MAIKFIGHSVQFDKEVTANYNVVYPRGSGIVEQVERLRTHGVRGTRVVSNDLRGFKALVIPYSYGDNAVLIRNSFGWVDVSHITKEDVLELETVGYAPIQPMSDTFAFMVKASTQAYHAHIHRVQAEEAARVAAYRETEKDRLAAIAVLTTARAIGRLFR